MTSRRPPIEDGDPSRTSRKSSVVRGGDRRSAAYRPTSARRASGGSTGGGGGGEHTHVRYNSAGKGNGGVGVGTHDSNAAGGGDAPGENIRVALRLRPQNELENSKRGRSCVEIHKGSTKITVDAPREGEYDFTFDRVLGERAGQGDVYDAVVAGLAPKAMDGLDTALIAYGATGSGKSHTMMGTGWGDGLGRTMDQNKAADGEEKKDDTTSTGKGRSVQLGSDAGMVPRIVRDMFKRMAEAQPETEFTVRVSYVEIYMEKILDLLNPTNRSLGIFHDSGEEEDAGGSNTGFLPFGGGVRIKGAAELCCHNEADALALLARGNAYRKLSSNDMSTNSNRSHSVFMIRLEQKDTDTGISRSSRMLLVDLAGSEMADKDASKPRPDQRKGNGAPSQKEAKMINRSFVSLANVIQALGEQQRPEQAEGQRGGTSVVPYQKSKLTRVLRHAFGGRCSTTMILTGSPSSFSISETIATIRFGQKCRRVTNRPQVCAELSPDEYRKQLAKSDRRQTELTSIVKALAAECRSLKTEGVKGRISEAAHRGPIWDRIDTILEDKENGGRTRFEIGVDRA